MAIVEAINIPIGVTGQDSVDKAANSYEDLGDAVAKTQLEAEKLAQQFGINDARTQQAIKVAGRYKQEMEELDFAIDGARGGVDQLFRASQGVIAGFELAAGATALFGGESEELEKILTKVQGAMAFSQGLKDLKEFAPAILNIAKATRTWLRSLNLLQQSLLGLSIAAIVALVYSLRDAFSSNSEETKKAALAQEEYNQKLRNYQIERIRIQQGDKAALEARNKDIQAILAQNNALIEQSKVREKIIADAKKLGVDSVTSLDLARREEVKNLKLTNTALENELLSNQKKIQDINKSSQATIDSQAKTQSDKRKAERIKKQQDDEKEFQDWLALELEKQQAADDTAKYVEQRRQQDLDDQEEAFQAWLEYETEKAEIAEDNANYLLKKKEEQAAKEKQIQEDIIESLYQLIDISNAFVQNKNNELNKEFDNRIEQLKKLGKSEEEIAQMRDGELIRIEQRSKDNFEVAKKLQYAQTLLSTIQGTQDAFTTAQKSPLTTLFPAYPFLQAAAAAAFGVAQLQQISQSSYDTKLKPSVSGASASASVPRFNAPSTRLPGGGDEFTQVRRVYVTERDITNVQEKVKVTESLSQF